MNTDKDNQDNESFLMIMVKALAFVACAGAIAIMLFTIFIAII